MSESFNHVITNERSKHVMVLLEFVRRYVMQHNQKKLAEIRKFNGTLTPRIKAQLEQRKRIAFDCQVCPAGRGWYEVDQGWRKYKVNVRGAVSCSCRQYELSGIPCAHLIKALREDNKANKPEDFVSDWYSKSRWEECYEECLKPVNGINMWRRSNDVKVLPPAYKPNKGQPPNNDRKRDSWEMKPKNKKKVKFQMTCTKCGIAGHNRRTCKNKEKASSSNAPKRRPGRPRKIVAEELSQALLPSQPNV